MKNIKLILTYFIILIGLLSSCSDTDETPQGEFAQGVFVVNEGNFTDANGAIGFYNESSGEPVQDVFQKANGTAVGGVVQSLYFHGDLAFFIDQVGNKIYVVDAETFESVATIEDGLSTPRYMLVLDDKIYVTNWAPFDDNYNYPSSYVGVYDLNSFEKTGTIKTDNGCEGIISFGGMVYTANSNSNTVDVIDPVAGAVVSQIEVAYGPVSFVEDKNGKFWVLSSSWLSGSALSQVDLSSENVLKSFAVSGSAKSLQINNAGDQLYYLSAPYGTDASVHSISIEATEDNSTTILTEPNLYGLGVHPDSEMLYIGNHNGFQGNGTILIYNGSELQLSFASGVGPNGFVFR